MEFVKHPFIKPGRIEAREYQKVLASAALRKGNTLIVAPTGVGKTIVACLVLAQRLYECGGKALFLAPTKPLVEQHTNTLKDLLSIGPITSYTGEEKKEERIKLWENSRIICATPQTVLNDLMSDAISLDGFTLLIFDEAHRAVGNYAYVDIAKFYFHQAKDPLVLALTASPGSKSERIKEVVRNLRIRNIEVRTERDKDVARYMKGIERVWIRVELPERMKEAKRLIEEMIKERLAELKSKGIIDSCDIKKWPKKEILELQKEMIKGKKFVGMKEIAQIIKLYHALELLELEGKTPFLKYLGRLKRKRSKAVSQIMSDIRILRVEKLVRETKEEHPKVKELLRILAQEKDARRILVFAHFKDTVKRIAEELKMAGFSACAFTGKTGGVTQKKQKEIIEKFRRGDFRILVSTSVGEEGLDIPEVDVVVFYEAVPSAIRSIQRRGRTGRKFKGKVYVLVTKGTRDEAYYWSSVRKEREMRRVIEEMRKSDLAQTTLHEFSESSGLVIFVDDRESEEMVELIESLGATVLRKRLEIADYVVSERIAIERKSSSDFVNSILDSRLFKQAQQLKELYEKPIFIIEGFNRTYFERNVHENAIRGALASLLVDFGIPIVFTEDREDSARMIVAIAKREQKEGKRPVRLRTQKRAMSLSEMQQFIVESLPGIGPELAKALLKHFKTVQSIFTAPASRLMEVQGIGEKTAKEIRKVITAPYGVKEEAKERKK